MANNEVSNEGSSVDIQSVSRVGQILALYGPRTTELTAVEVSERLGLNRTTAYRYCASLVTAGILERGHHRGTFVLGGLMLQLGIQALGHRRVIDVAPSYLRELSTAVGKTAVLSLWGVRGPVVALVQEDSRRAVVVTVHLGTQLDLTSAQMRVFLAHHPDHQLVERILDELPERERVELEAAVYTVRRTGYSLVRLPDGIIGAAAPVFDENGICATIALLGSDQLGDASSSSPAVTSLIATAAALSEQLSSGRTGAPVAEL